MKEDCIREYADFSTSMTLSSLLLPERIVRGDALLGPFPEMTVPRFA